VTIFLYNLSPSFLWPIPYTFHFILYVFFTKSLSSFLKTVVAAAAVIAVVVREYGNNTATIPGEVGHLHHDHAAAVIAVVVREYGNNTATIPGEVGHLHHDHAHLFGNDDDVIATLVPLGHLAVQLGFLNAEHLYLLLDLDTFGLRQCTHHRPVTHLLTFVKHVLRNVTRCPHQWQGIVASGIRRMNKVNRRRAQLVLGWLTIFGQVYHHSM